MSHPRVYYSGMTRHKRIHERSRAARRTGAGGWDLLDRQWRAYYRHVFLVCAERFSPSEELTFLALTVAELPELREVVETLFAHKTQLRLQDSAVEDLEATLSPSVEPERQPGCSEQKRTTEHRDAAEHHCGARENGFVAHRGGVEGHEAAISETALRQHCYRAARHEDRAQALIVDVVAARVAESYHVPELPAIVREVGELFSLTEAQTRIIAALCAVEDDENLETLLRRSKYRTTVAVMAELADLDTTEFVQETAAGFTLERLGLVCYRSNREHALDIAIAGQLLFALRSNTMDDLRAGLFEETSPPRFGLEEFPVSSEELRTCSAALRGGHPVLIAGRPGIGKTEFVRTLVASLGRNAFTLAAGARAGSDAGPRKSESKSTRFNAVRMAANILSPEHDVLIVDEADAVLQSAGDILSIFGGGGSYDKAELNALLEHLPVPTVWITNRYAMIPDSAMRRFGHVLAFPQPNLDTRVRMIEDRLAPLASEPTHSSWAREIAMRYDLPPAAIDRAARIVSSELSTGYLAADEVPKRVSGYIEQASSGALARDVRRLPAASPSFDPRFCCTSQSLERLERLALQRAHSGNALRLLFGGPPGGGKTQYALRLAAVLGRDVVLKRPSDLLSKYVGESEQQIAAAFRRAVENRSVLVLDEADALLYDRSIAVRSWEHSQIAEFLQQLQEFDGILIACTNRLEAVDPAVRRRFHKHVTFAAIDEKTLPAALAHIFPEIAFSAYDLATLKAGPPLMMSDLATAAEMLTLDSFDESVDDPGSSSTAVNAAEVVQEILANARARDTSREIGF